MQRIMIHRMPSGALLGGAALVALFTVSAGAQDSTVKTTTVITTTTTSKNPTPEQRTAAALQSKDSVPLIIPEGTPLKVRVERAISSASVNPGDTVTMRMAADYSEYGHVLISQGARVRGTVAKVDRRSAGGDPGDVTLEALAVRAVDGQRIPLNGTKSATGKNRQAQATALALLTLGLGSTKKGLSAVIPIGTEFTVYTAAPATIVVPR